ncbi:Isocitrate dehydrogenase [NAD] subunit beta, mitochondrial [Exaiptasia diaphana]|nr:Isocitrate dehydrogenase [NAD] subunit beta, mitochondrial [Exaiptasia diaphana]
MRAIDSVPLKPYSRPLKMPLPVRTVDNVHVYSKYILKKGDGLFLNTCAEVSKLYPKIKFEGMIVDNTCMQRAKISKEFEKLKNG